MSLFVIAFLRGGLFGCMEVLVGYNLPIAGSQLFLSVKRGGVPFIENWSEHMMCCWYQNAKSVSYSLCLKRIDM